MRRRLLKRAWAGPAFFAVLLFCALAAAQEGGRDVHFSAVREGELIKVSASVELAVDRALAWEVLTDYGHYASFISGLDESRVVGRHAQGLIVEQKGAIGVFFFKQSVRTRLLVTESPPASVVSRGLEGSFKDLNGRYDLQPTASGIRLQYSGSFIPDFYLPPLIGMALVRYNLERNFSELAAEIVKRGAYRK